MEPIIRCMIFLDTMEDCLWCQNMRFSTEPRFNGIILFVLWTNGGLVGLPGKSDSTGTYNILHAALHNIGSNHSLKQLVPTILRWLESVASSNSLIRRIWSGARRLSCMCIQGLRSVRCLRSREPARHFSTACGFFQEVRSWRQLHLSCPRIR